MLAGVADEETVQAVEKCAYDIGIAFQIQDDILDVVGDVEERGKPVGSDALNHKQTYVTIHGLRQAEKDVEVLTDEAIGILESFGGDNDFLKELLLSLIHRRK